MGAAEARMDFSAGKNGSRGAVIFPTLVPGGSGDYTPLAEPYSSALSSGPTSSTSTSKSQPSP